MTRASVIAIALLALASVPARGYEESTHFSLSRKAVTGSWLVSRGFLLTDLGLRSYADNEKFPLSGYGNQMIIDLVGWGSIFEDSNSYRQAFRHFYEATSGSALSMVWTSDITIPSPSWATESARAFEKTAGGPEDTQERSFRDGRRYLFSALTEPDEAKRRENFGLVFTTLGHVMHHLQDMAQPQHVRNDPHCDKVLCFIGNQFTSPMRFYSPSLYERFTASEKVAPNLYYGLGEYSAVFDETDTTTFTTPQSFWSTGQPNPMLPGKGIAEYTSRGFVSSGTNYRTASAIPPPDRRQYLLPRLSDATLEFSRLEDLCRDEVRFSCPSGAKGEIAFLSSTVTDSLRPSQTRVNSRSSTYSIFDDDLARTPNGQRIYALNRWNLLEAHKFLIPRAIGYSAGMVNYFFRGRIDLEREPGTNDKWRIRNLGPDRMQGRFALYYDAVDGKRYPVSVPFSWSSMSVEPKGAAGEADVIRNLQFNPPLFPAPSNPGEYMLVFSGTMGEEAPLESKYIHGEDGAVVGRMLEKGDLVITSALGSNFQTWRSSDAGKSWVRKGVIAGPGGGSLHYLGKTTRGDKTLLAPIAISGDGGESWTGLSSADVRWPVLRERAARLPDGTLIGGVTEQDPVDGKWRPKVAYSTDNGVTWGPTQEATGLVDGISDIYSTESGTLYTHSQYLVRSGPCPPPLEAYICDYYEPWLFRRSPEGPPWWVPVNQAPLNHIAYIGKYTLDDSGLKMDRNGKETLLANRFVREAGGYVQQVVRSMDGGETWTVMSVPPEISNMSQEIWQLAYGADGAIHAYTHNVSGTRQHRLYKSGDAGTSWTQSGTLPDNTVDPGIYGLAMIPRTGEIPGLQRP